MAGRWRWAPTSGTPSRCRRRSTGSPPSSARRWCWSTTPGHPRQPAVQDDRRRLGPGHARAPAGIVPHDPRGAEAHDRGEVGPDRQSVEHVGAGQPRPGELRDREGRPAGLHQDGRDGARQVRRHRERHRTRLHRHRDDHRATAARIGEEWEPYVATRAAAIPVACAGQPEDIAHTVSFLVSEGAGFVSGQVIYVAGGPKALRTTGRGRGSAPASAYSPKAANPTLTAVSSHVAPRRPRRSRRARRPGRSRWTRPPTSPPATAGRRPERRRFLGHVPDPADALDQRLPAVGGRGQVDVLHEPPVMPRTRV